MNKNNLTESEINALIGMLSKRMNVNPQELKKNISEGNIKNERVAEILSDKEKLNQLFNSPQVQELLRALRNHK